MTPELIPAILVNNYQQFVRQLRRVEPFVKTVHLDVMDGQFVDNQTFADAKRVGKIKHKLRLGIHLMVDQPHKYIQEWARAGAFRYIFHREAAGDQEFEKLIAEITAAGMQAGVAINPETKVESVKSFLPKLELVLVMGVNPGRSGQPFQTKVLEKISILKKARPQILVGVDGGVNLKNAGDIIIAGADFLVANTAIYKSKNIEAAIAQFKEILAGRRETPELGSEAKNLL